MIDRNYFHNMTHLQRMLILIGICLIAATAFTMLGYGIINLIYGIQMADMQASMAFTNENVNIGALKILQSMMSIGIFIIPAFIYSWLYSDHPFQYLGLKKAKDNFSLLLIVAAMLLLIPFINTLGEWNSYMKLPSFLSGIEQWMREQEDYLAQATTVLLKMPDIREMFVNIVVIAFLPALSEELMFRGVIQRQFSDWFNNKNVAVILTAFIFSAIHVQFYGFIPRFLLGILLGYLYIWSGSLWLSVLAHFVNNGAAVVFTYLYSQQILTTNPDKVGTEFSDIIIVLVGLAIAIPLIMIIRKRNTILISTE